jgi:hypothetical protein
MHMRKGLIPIVLGVLLLNIIERVPLAAQSHPTDDIPKIILTGLDAYKAEGAEAAIAAWIKGGPIDGSKDALTQANTLRQVQDYYGSYKTFDVIHTRIITPNTHIIYMTLNYEKGPLFTKFVAYQTAQGWILTSFTFNTKEDVILPASF